MEILEIGLEDAFWIIFVGLISISTINSLRVFEETIPSLASKSCYVTLLNKGSWVKLSHATNTLNLSFFKKLDLKATFKKDKVLVEVTGFSKEYNLPFAFMNMTLGARNYKIIWNESLFLVRVWEG